jgi:hypothetical protein
MRVIKGEMRGAKSGGGVTLLRRVSTGAVVRGLNSGELLGCLGGVSGTGGKRGKGEGTVGIL